MVRIIGMLMLICSTTFIGIEQSIRLLNRVNFFEEYIRFISYIKTQMSYSLDSVENIFFNYNPSGKLSFINYCFNLDEDFSSLNDLWRASVDKIPKLYGLTKDDIRSIKSFGKGLGLSDLEGQMANCSLALETAEKCLDDAVKNKNKKYRLYQVLGLSSGICIALIFV